MSQYPNNDKLPDRSRLESWARQALEAARKAGADHAEVTVSAARALAVSVRMNEVESVQFQRDRDLGLTVYIGHRSGAASTTDVTDEGLTQAAEAAVAIARATEEDPCSGLPEVEQLANDFPDMDICHPWPITAESAAEIARACEAAAFAVDKRVTGSEGASVDMQHHRSVLGNSLGFFGYQDRTDHALSCAVIASDGNSMQQGYWYDTRCAPDDLLSPEATGSEAGKRAASHLGARKLSTRRASVLFTAEMARSLFASFCGAISGSSLYRRASFLLDRVGERVFAPQVQICQRPFLSRGAASTAFDSEGVATRDRDLVVDGTLQGYLLGCYAARKLGLQTTGNAGGVFNLVVQPTGGDLRRLLSELETGLLVTDMMGTGANLATGDYSRGAAGFWVENGAIAYPVQEITLAGSLQDMYRNIRMIGNDVDTRGRIRSGSVLIDDMMIGG